MTIKEKNFDELKPLKSCSNKNQTSGSIEINLICNLKNCNKMSKFEKIFYFGLNNFTFFVYGLSLSAFGISVKEYQRNIMKDGHHMTMTELSVGLSLCSICGCVSCLLAVWTLDVFNRQLQFGFLLLIYGIVTVVYPLCTSYTVYLWNSAVAGAVISYIHSIPSVWVVELFQKNAKTYVQILHFFFPIGEFFGPVLFSPFLKNEVLNKTTDFEPKYRLNEINESSNWFYNLFEVTKTSSIWVPYMVVSGLKFLIAILVLSSYFIRPYRKPVENTIEISNGEELAKSSISDKSSKNLVSVNQDYCIYEEGKKHLSRNYLIFFGTFVCLIIGIHLANESNAYYYISSYILDTHKDKLTEKTSAYGQGLLSISITIGRLANIFITMYIKVQNMIFINFILVVLGNLILFFFGTHLNAVWFSITLMGLGFSSLNPFLISLVEQRIGLTNRMIALMSFSSYVFQTILPLLIGNYLDSNSMNFIILNLVVTTCGLSLYIILITFEIFRLKNVRKLGRFVK